jgi:hypothetical protein
MRPRLLILWLIFLLTASAVSAQSGGPQAELERNRIGEGESVILSLTVPGDLDGEPDLTPLERDFDILGRSQSSHTSIINGRMDSKRVWRLTLAPRRAGTLEVPPLPVGGSASPALRLEVSPGGDPAEGGQAPQAFIEVSAEPQSPYVQQQIVYTVRVFHRVDLRDGALNDPAVDGMPVERLGEDRSYREYHHGHRYSVIERRYALFPQHSGTLEIPPPVLSANVLVPGGRGGGSLAQRFFGRDPFGGMNGLFQETRPLRVRGKPLSLDVRPQPPSAQWAWLPALDLTLSENWSPEGGFRVGEPVTRTVTLRARGLTDAQLPDLTPTTVDGLKRYADRPQGETRPADGGLEAVKQFKEALVPTRVGDLQLPEVRVQWWDTATDAPREAVLPARTIQVLPAPAGQAARPPEPIRPSPLENPPLASPPTTAPALPAGLGAKAGPWPWIAAGLTVAWLLTLAFWLRERRLRQAGRRATLPGQTTPAKPDAAAVRRACRSGDAAAARRALLDWGRVAWPQSPPWGLGELAQRLGDEAAGAALGELDAELYAPTGGGWDGAEAWERLGNALRRPADGRPALAGDPLPPLYPVSGA